MPELASSPDQVQWATPSTEGAEDSEGVPLCFRTISDLLDTTEEVVDFEYSGLFLQAVDVSLLGGDSSC